MFSFFSKLLAFLRSSSDLNKIVSGLDKTLVSLEAHAAEKANEIASHAEKIVELEAKKLAASSEVERAKQIASNLQQLLAK